MSCPCQSPEEMEYFGCEAPSQFPLWEDEETEVYGCPAHLITERCTDFIRRLDFMDVYGCNTRYEDLPNRFIEAIGHYKSKLAEYSRAVHKRGA